jgi:hypothetical protein
VCTPRGARARRDLGEVADPGESSRLGSWRRRKVGQVLYTLFPSSGRVQAQRRASSSTRIGRGQARSEKHIERPALRSGCQRAGRREGGERATRGCHPALDTPGRDTHIAGRRARRGGAWRMKHRSRLVRALWSWGPDASRVFACGASATSSQETCMKNENMYM